MGRGQMSQRQRVPFLPGISVPYFQIHDLRDLSLVDLILNKFTTVIALFGWEPRQKRVHWMPHYVLYISSSPTAGLQSKARST